MKKKLQRFLLEFCKLIYRLLMVLPLQHKVVASAFGGCQYADNPRFVVEELHRMDPTVKIVWISIKGSCKDAPDYVRTVSGILPSMLAYATASVWIETHHIPLYLKRRSGQLMIETWHGGLGIKRIGNDATYFENKHRFSSQAAHTSASANVFLSNCDHLTRIYRKGFGYTGKVWKSGYPKNDYLLSTPDAARAAVRRHYGLSAENSILLYAPTFRQYETNEATFGVDMSGLKNVLEASWGGSWTMIVRWHPTQAKKLPAPQKMYGDTVLDGSAYPNMQELIQGCDAFLTDYSSAVFDAALCGIPCLLYTPDFDLYKQERGVYYELQELPFPHASDNPGLIELVKTYDRNAAVAAWEKFKERTGLYESGHAASDVAAVALEWLKGNCAILDSIPNESL